jgi:hypothetical protein
LIWVLQGIAEHLKIRGRVMFVVPQLVVADVEEAFLMKVDDLYWNRMMYPSTSSANSCRDPDSLL